MEREIKQLENVLNMLDLVNVPSIVKYSYPINEIEERAKFFYIRNYEPKFLYSQPNKDNIENRLNLLKNIMRKLDKIDVNIDLKILVEGMIKRKETELLFLMHLGSKSNVILSKNIDGTPTYETYKIALNLVENINEESDLKKVDAKDVANYFLIILNRYGLKEWNVILDEHRIAVAVDGKNKRLYLPLNRKYSLQEVLRLSVHEIGTHIFRKENSDNQISSLFRKTFPNYLITEEGMAIYHEYTYGLLNKSRLREYALRYIATYLTYNMNSFHYVFNTLYDLGIDKKDAWRITLRAYRGGGLIKDYVYLEGFLKIKRFIELHGKKGEDTLMCCRNSIDYYSLIHDFISSGIVSPPSYNTFDPYIRFSSIFHEVYENIVDSI